MRCQYKLFFGVATQFCYVGAQVGVASQLIKYSVESVGITDSRGSDRCAIQYGLFAIAQGLFAISRFVAVRLMMFVKPCWMLMVFMTGVMIFIAASMGAGSNGGVVLLSLVLFFESYIFPTIFTLSIRGLGRHTKRGWSWIVASVSGGALFPSLTGLVVDHKDYHIAMCVPAVSSFVAFAFPIYFNSLCAKELDSFRKMKIDYQDREGVTMQNTAAVGGRNRSIVGDRSLASSSRYKEKDLGAKPRVDELEVTRSSSA